MLARSTFQISSLRRALAAVASPPLGSAKVLKIKAAPFSGSARRRPLPLLPRDCLAQVHGREALQYGRSSHCNPVRAEERVGFTLPERLK